MAERLEEQLFNVLRTAFSLEDLRTLSFLLGVDDDSLKQDNRDVLARELIRHMRHNGRLDELVERARRERPNIQWPGSPPVAPGVPTLVVDPLHRGDYPTVGLAVAAAQPGYLIKVRPGYYNEGIVIDKPLEIVGDGPVDRIVIRAGIGSVIKMSASRVEVRNLTLRQTGGDWHGVDIAVGHLVIEDCDINSQGRACVAIHNGAFAAVRRNRIHDGERSGIFLYNEGQGVIEDNDIGNNSRSGIVIRAGSNPIVRRNRIYRSKLAGILTQGEGVIENNDIASNGYAGIEIKTGGNPTVRNNRIYEGRKNGILVDDRGLGVIEDNEIADNILSGIAIKNGSNPVVRRNRIFDGRRNGIVVYDEGQAIIEDNDITGNDLAGIAVKTAGNPTVRKNRIHRNGHHGIWVYEEGAGTFRGNDLRDNAKGAWLIDEGSQPLVKRSNNTV
jgi:F-box protein 11